MLFRSYLIDELAKEGLEIFDMTGRWGYDRGFGIHEWLEKHKTVTHYVVLDDEINPDYPQWNVPEHLVQTSYWSGGLKPEHVHAALELLGTREVSSS